VSPNRQRVLAAIALLAIVGLLKGLESGFDRGLLFALCGVGVMLAIAVYFENRRDVEPDRLERTLAGGWLVFRRIVCFGAAFLVVAGMALVAFAAPITAGVVLGLVIAGGFAAFFIWVGLYGQGKQRFLLSDDVRLHEENKRRYRWRW
jgi:hypothetical protein